MGIDNNLQGAYLNISSGLPSSAVLTAVFHGTCRSPTSGSDWHNVIFFEGASDDFSMNFRQTDGVFNLDTSGSVPTSFATSPVAGDRFWAALTNAGAGAGNLIGYWGYEDSYVVNTVNMAGKSFAPTGFFFQGNPYGQNQDGSGDNLRIWAGVVLDLTAILREVRSPRPVRMANLWDDFPLYHIGDLRGRVGGKVWTVTGTLTSVAHVPILGSGSAEDDDGFVQAAVYDPLFGQATSEPRRGFIFVPRQYMSIAGSSHPLAPLSAAVGTTSWFNEESRPKSRGPVMGEPPPPPAQALASLAVGTSWQTDPPRVVVRSRVAQDVAHPPIVPAVSAANLTWFSHSPMLMRASFGTDGGAGGISPLNPTFWYPDIPDRPSPRRVVFEAQPGQDWLSGRARSDLSWALQPPIWVRRTPARGHETISFLPVFQAQAPAWLPQATDVVRRPPLRDAESFAVHPLAMAQAPAWLPQLTELVRRGVKPGDMGSGWTSPAPVASAVDLSWLGDSAVFLRARRPMHQPSHTPQATTVTLSSWGWIPEAHPARKGIRVVDATPVSALVPPAILTTMPWGWLPEGPALRARLRLAFEPSNAPVPPTVPLSAFGWAIDPGDRAARQARARGFEVLEPTGPGKSPWGWAVEALHPTARRRQDASVAALVDIPRAAVLDWLAEQAHVIQAQQRRSGEAVLPSRPPTTDATFWEPSMPFVVARRAQFHGEQRYPVADLVISALPPLPWTPQQPVTRVIRECWAAIINGDSVMIPVLLPPTNLSTVLRAYLTEVGEWRAILRS